MYYETSITIPAGTLATAPVIAYLKMTQGVIHRVEVGFRPGTDMLVGIRIEREGSQLFPSNPEGDLRDDGRTIVWDDYKPMEAAPYMVKIIGYAPDALYDHTVRVRMGVLPRDVITPISGFGVMFKKFFALVGIKE